LLGGKKRAAKAAMERIRHESRGRLSEELWAADAAHEAYFDAALALDEDFIAVADGGRIEVDPLGRDERSTLDSLIAPLEAAGNPRLSVSTDSYIWSEAESWEDYDEAAFAAMLERGCEGLAGQMNEPRFRFGGGFWGVFGHHPTQPVRAPFKEFTPAWDYIRSRTAWQRLEALAEHQREIFFGRLPDAFRGSAGITIGDMRRLHEVNCAAGVLVERFVQLRRAGLWT
jgi:hypothetical protein